MKMSSRALRRLKGKQRGQEDINIRDLKLTDGEGKGAELEEEEGEEEPQEEEVEEKQEAAKSSSNRKAKKKKNKNQKNISNIYELVRAKLQRLTLHSSFVLNPVTSTEIYINIRHLSCV